MKIVGKIIRVLIIILIIFEGTKLFFLIFANMENRLIQESEIVNGKDVIYFNLIDATGDICDLELCEALPELKVIKIEDGVFLRIGIDSLNSYYLKSLFFKSGNEPEVTLPENKEMFKNRTYADQLLSWQSILLKISDDVYLIYFLNNQNPNLNFVEVKNAEEQLAWEKFNTNSLADKFLVINKDNYVKYVSENDIRIDLSFEELNEKIQYSYKMLINYEKRLRTYSLALCVIKIVFYIYLLFAKKINGLIGKKTFKKI